MAIIAGAITSLLLTTAHSLHTWNLWAYISLVPVLIASRRTNGAGVLLLTSLISSSGPALLMFESIVQHNPLAALGASLTHVPQVLLPLATWTYLRRSTNILECGVYFVITWLIWQEARMMPVPNGVLASFYSLSYALEPHSLSGLPEIYSPVLASLLILACNVLVATLLQTPTFKHLVILIFCIGCILLTSNLESDQTTGSVVELSSEILAFQPALSPQLLEMASVDSRIMEMVHVATAASILSSVDESSVVLLPEAYFRNLESAEQFRRYLDTNVQAMLAGISLLQSEYLYNSVLLADAHTLQNVYDKWQLIPLVESRVFESGDSVAIVELAQGNAVGILICMDGVNPWLFRQTVFAGAELMVVLSASDYGWGYRTPYFQLHVVRHLAAATGVRTIFLTSSGPSAFIEADGSIVLSLDQGTQGLLSLSSQ